MTALDMLLVTVPAPCDWINSNQRLHRMVKAKRTATWRAAAKDAAADAGSFDGPVRIIATVHKTRGGRWDAGNLYPTAKAIVDGLVDAGVIPDDSNEWVTGPDMRAGAKTTEPCVVVAVKATKETK